MGLADSLAAEADRRIGRKLIDDMAEALILRGAVPEDLGRLARLKVSSSDYQSLTKDAEGEAHIHDLRKIGLSAEWFVDPEWPVVQPAAPVKVRRPKPSPSSAAVKRTVILPDQQYGFRRVDGELIPTHDRQAIAAAMLVTKAVKPDRIVNLGDLIDLPEFTAKFVVTPEMAETTQPAIDEAHHDLAAQCEITEDVDVLEGNHDDRLALSVISNAKAALRLRQAASTPDDWPVLSLPHLLRLDDLGVTYNDG